MSDATARRARDSSVTRVAPVFAQLSTRTDAWVESLLELAGEGAGFPERDWQGLPLSPATVHYGDKARGRSEFGLPAPRALLEWLIHNAEARPGQALSSNAGVREKRQRLLDRDPEAVREALAALEKGGGDSAWCRFEGTTYPDAVIETPGARVVVEGKRTERGPTTRTTWMEGRHQMLRHIDAAWDVRGERRVFGLFIVEAEGTPPQGSVSAAWRDAAASTRSREAIANSLPHRSSEERAAIARGFVGVTTWQRVCERFEIPQDTLIEIRP